MVLREIWEKFPEVYFEIFEISREQRGKFKKLKIRPRGIFPEFHESIIINLFSVGITTVTKTNKNQLLV